MRAIVADFITGHHRGDLPILLVWAMALADFLRNEAVLGTVCAALGFAFQIYRRLKAKSEDQKLTREMQLMLRTAYIEGERNALVKQGVLTAETGQYKRVLESITGELEIPNGQRDNS
jgi:hypothetical protein